MSERLKSDWYTPEIQGWILEEGRFARDLDELISALGGRLVDAGAPLWRLRFSFRTIHPLVAAVSCVWERESAKAEQRVATHGMENRPGYKGSPMEIVGRTGNPFRKRLEEGLADDDHPVLHEMKDRGATDYFIIPMQFREARRPMLVIVSDRPSGFTDKDLGCLSDLTKLLAPVLEVFSQERKISAIAAAYLGGRTSKRVLDGQIIRGDVERIQAAVLISDMRGWSNLSRQLPAEEALAIANQYFEILAEAVESHNGEILKFMGDGILAVFQTGSGPEGEKNACQSASRAARMAMKSSSKLRESFGVSFGIGLSFGDVLYGNIGSKTRLDFTVMGEAVNLAARFESLSETMGHPVLFTRAFADNLNVKVRLIGLEKLKGYQDPFEVFGWASDQEEADKDSH